MRDPKPSWQKTLAQGFSSSQALLAFLDLPSSGLEGQVEQQFPTRVPLGFAKRMQKGNPLDPLLLQVLATEAELLSDPGYQTDPLQEQQANVLPGLLQKYQYRVLLTLAGSCAVNCRFCFRRHFPYRSNQASADNLQATYDYLREHVAIREVILSGGDPLLQSDVALRDCFQQIARIPHIKSIRIHSRIPIVLPERITDAFLALLSETRLHKVLVVHCNHPQELNEDVADICRLVRNSGCHLLNQSVLLKGVNDSPEILAALSERLFDCGVLPYYLHLLDKIAGTAHFDLAEETALALHRKLQTLLPGYLVPRLVREEAGKESKTLML